MAKLEYLVIHCTDTPEDRPVSKKEIERWHLTPKPKGRGWKRLGYSDIIHLDGTKENLTPYDEDEYVTNSEMTWGAAGINSKSRHLVVVGGRTKDNKHIQFDFAKPSQIETLLKECRSFIHHHPNAKIAGHYHFSEYKTCPNFDIEGLLLSNGFAKENIYTSDKKTPFDILIKPQ